MKLFDEVKVAWANTKRACIVYALAGFILAALIIGTLT